MDSWSLEESNRRAVEFLRAGRLADAEAMARKALATAPNDASALQGLLEVGARRELVASILPEMLRREVEHRGLLQEGASLAMQLVGWVELA